MAVPWLTCVSDPYELITAEDALEVEVVVEALAWATDDSEV
jgi:hypothetical protein